MLICAGTESDMPRRHLSSIIRDRTDTDNDNEGLHERRE